MNKKPIDMDGEGASFYLRVFSLLCFYLRVFLILSWLGEFYFYTWCSPSHLVMGYGSRPVPLYLRSTCESHGGRAFCPKVWWTFTRYTLSQGGNGAKYCSWLIFAIVRGLWCRSTSSFLVWLGVYEPSLTCFVFNFLDVHNASLHYVQGFRMCFDPI